MRWMWTLGILGALILQACESRSNKKEPMVRVEEESIYVDMDSSEVEPRSVIDSSRFGATLEDVVLEYVIAKYDSGSMDAIRDAQYKPHRPDEDSVFLDTLVFLSGSFGIDIEKYETFFDKNANETEADSLYLPVNSVYHHGLPIKSIYEFLMDSLHVNSGDVLINIGKPFYYRGAHYVDVRSFWKAATVFHTRRMVVRVNGERQVEGTIFWNAYQDGYRQAKHYNHE